MEYIIVLLILSPIIQKSDKSGQPFVWKFSILLCSNFSSEELIFLLEEGLSLANFDEKRDGNKFEFRLSISWIFGLFRLIRIGSGPTWTGLARLYYKWFY